jgi:hypothetical protein
MLAVDLRFPKPKPLRREFIELIWKERGGRGGKEVDRVGEVDERRRGKRAR